MFSLCDVLCFTKFDVPMLYVNMMRQWVKAPLFTYSSRLCSLTDLRDSKVRRWYELKSSNRKTLSEAKISSAQINTCNTLEVQIFGIINIKS